MSFELQLSPLIAHRGASAYRPENTLEAFRHASALGASWIEFDVSLSLDSVPVVIHDSTLKRTTNGRGWVRWKSYQRLQQLDAGSWFEPQYSNCLIPSLQQVLVLAQECNLGVNIELKPGFAQANKLAKLVLQQLADLDFPLSKVLCSSFSTSALYALRKQHESMPLGLLLDKWDDNWLATANTLKCHSVNLGLDFIDATMVQSICNEGYLVMCYTVNERLVAEELFDVGVNAIFSDHPDLLSDVPVGES